MIHITSHGSVQIAQNIDGFTREMADRWLKKAVTAGIKPVAEAAKTNAPVRFGTLKASITFTVKSKGTKGWFVRGVAGPKTKIRVPVGIVTRGKHKGQILVAIPTRYAHLVEFGHKIVINGQVIGHRAPVGFMRRAWASEGGTYALARVETSLRDQIANWIVKP